MQKERGLWLALAFSVVANAALGQIDPQQRELVQLGFSQAVQGASPVGAYAYYYLNEPNFFGTNITLRLALAPVYLDSEIGFAHLLGPNTDLGVGLAGGGFADNYYEVRQGKYVPSESFTGDGAEGSISVYHLFNPGQLIPLSGLVRVKARLSMNWRPGMSCRQTIGLWDGGWACGWGGGNRCFGRTWRWKFRRGTKDSFAPSRARMGWRTTGSWRRGRICFGGGRC